MAKLGAISINNIPYPCDAWEATDQGKDLSVAWMDGYWDGAAESRYLPAKPNKYFYAHGWDMTSPPYARLALSLTAITGFTNTLTAEYPLYIVADVQPAGSVSPPAGTNLVYIFQADRVWKINRDTMTQIYSTARAGVNYGRPARFEGYWYIPRGDKRSQNDGTGYPDATRLTPLDAGNEATEIHANAQLNVKARHFAVLQDQGISYLCRAFSSSAGGAANRIEKSASGGFTASPGDIGTEVGQQDYSIADLLIYQGELLVIKPNGPYLFDPEGNSQPLQDYVGSSPEASFQVGSNSDVVGAYAYWPHTSGFWRIFGSALLPAGFEADPRFMIRNASDEIDQTDRWEAVCGYGRWLYAVRGNLIWQGYIQNDGLPIWHGAIYDLGAATTVYIGLLEGKTALLPPELWVFASTAVGVATLSADGSTRTASSSSRGVAHMADYPLRMPDIDWDLPHRLKQLRKLWFLWEGLTASGITIQPVVQRDGAAAQNWGAALTTTGYHENTGVMGTSDTFRSFRPGVDASGGVSATDPRLRAWGADAVSSTIWKATILLSNKELVGFSEGINGSLQNFRTLRDGIGVEVQGPGWVSSVLMHLTRMSVKQTSVDEFENPEYTVDLQFESFNQEDGSL